MRSMQSSFIPLSAIVAGLLCMPALAQQDRSDNRSRDTADRVQQQGSPSQQSRQSKRTASSQQARQGQQPQGPSVVVGEVIGMRKVTLAGRANVDHQLVKLRTEGDSSVVVDLGAFEDRQKIPDIRNGDRIIAIGKQGRINDQPVLFARQVGQLYSAGNAGIQQQSNQRQASAEEGGASQRR